MNQTAICNLALLRLGIAQPIADITESSTAARACNAVYQQCVETMLRERPWPFAVRSTTLALVGTELHPDWFYTFRYPSGYLNVHRIVPAPGTASVAPVITPYSTDARAFPDTFPFALGSDASGKLIHTDISTALALGTVYISDTAQYDALFVSALAWFIASEIAVSLTKTRELYGMAYSEYEKKVSEAFSTAANEPKPRDAQDADMIRARD